MTDGTLVLDNPLFKIAQDGHFRKSSAQEAIFAMKLGDVEVVLPIPAICREFRIEADSGDGKMLALIERALDFVNVLRPGDKFPSEVLTGEPSWEITPAHRLRAYQRLSFQLASWLTGEERVFTSAEELNQIAEDPATKKRWNNAFDEAAKKLGFEHNGREQVMAIVAGLAEEFAYIEALRDHFERVTRLGAKVQGLRRLYGRENSVREIAESVARLVLRAQDLLGRSFEEIDGQTGEILSVLRNPARQTAFIRKERDQLYCRLQAWSELFTRWEMATLERSEANVALLRDTYRFLAPRFMPSMEWLLMSRLIAENKMQRKTAMVW